MAAEFDLEKATVPQLLREIIRVTLESDGELVPGNRRLIEGLLARTDLVTLGVPRRAIHGDASGWLYYDTELAISFGVAPMKPVPAHDHGDWQILTVYNGSIEYIAYKHTPSEKPNEEVLEVLSHQVYKAGDILTVGRPPEDAHEWVALETDTYVLGVYPAEYSSIRRYFQGWALGTPLETGTLFTRRYFDRRELAYKGG